jgi:hypothetical protein
VKHTLRNALADGEKFARGGPALELEGKSVSTAQPGVQDERCLGKEGKQRMMAVATRNECLPWEPRISRGLDHNVVPALLDFGRLGIRFPR